MLWATTFSTPAPSAADTRFLVPSTRIRSFAANWAPMFLGLIACGSEVS
jgi:hypothetical protein